MKQIIIRNALVQCVSSSLTYEMRDEETQGDTVRRLGKEGTTSIKILFLGDMQKDASIWETLGGKMMRKFYSIYNICPWWSFWNNTKDYDGR